MLDDCMRRLFSPGVQGWLDCVTSAKTANLSRLLTLIHLQSQRHRAQLNLLRQRMRSPVTAGLHVI